ncbi:hypothetical protein VNO77_39421 [Canavalia gladiata]|uniref:Uncharacterized protein n=1 Tax=Canavalia gladiata TaxID=3824 RepID=A0AAN9PZR7_CANGL
MNASKAWSDEGDWNLRHDQDNLPRPAEFSLEDQGNSHFRTQKCDLPYTIVPLNSASFKLCYQFTSTFLCPLPVIPEAPSLEFLDQLTDTLATFGPCSQTGLRFSDVWGDHSATHTFCNDISIYYWAKVTLGE